MMTCIALVVAALACAQSQTPDGPPPNNSAETGEVGIAAIWQQDTISWNELRPILAERAGAAALEEAMLDKRIHAAVAAKSIAITEEMMRAEETALREQLSPDAQRADRLLDEVRARQGLGPSRWRALLWRNAALRAMVAVDVQILPTQIDAALDAAHGPKRRARVIAVPDMRTAQQVSERLSAGELFADVAADVSTDASAARGGLIAPVSKLDPGFPGAFREALWALTTVGSVSPPVMAGSGVVLVLYESDVPAQPGPLPADARVSAERAVRLAQERGRMEELARDFVRGAKPTIFDDSLADSWKRTNNR
jgi:parvulin-like peptidyl-prolyl isomerase